jgi:hypothetical protein
VNKAELVNRCLQVICELISGDIASCAKVVADFGVAQVEDDAVQQGELVLLSANSRDPMGRPCVRRCEFLQAWVYRRGALVEVEAREDALLWGELCEKKKH